MRTSIVYIKGKAIRRKVAIGIGLNAVLVTLAIAGAITLGIFNPAEAEADVTPPTLTSASIANGGILDTVNTLFPGYNTAAINLFTNDNLSSTTAPLIIYTSPSGKQTATGGSNGVNGNTDWQALVNFPQYAEAGLWTASIYLEDFSGNKVTYSSSLLHTRGINIDIRLNGIGDSINPTLVSLVRTNIGSLNTDGGSAFANFDVTLADNISGLAVPTLSYVSPSGGQATSEAVCTQYEGHTSLLSVFNCAVEFKHFAENGTWIPDLTYSDGAGNIVHLTNSQLLLRSINARVTITGTSDTEAPILTSADITFSNPPADNIPYGGAVMTVTGLVSDNLSGMEGTSAVRYTSPSGNVVSGSMDSPTSGIFTSNIALPMYAEGGTWQPSVYTSDTAGNHRLYTATDLKNLGTDLAITVNKNVTRTATPGDTVTSDYENDGATTSNPIEAAVTTPTGGPVSIVIVQSNNITDSTNGYTFFDRQVNITAPVETVASPLTLAFTIDSTKVPSGENASTLQITRNGAVVPACNDQVSASPDPCVFSRQNLSSGDIQVKIHSTTASAWASGFPTKKFVWKGFDKPAKDYPGVNKEQAGQVVNVKFRLSGADENADILEDGQPVVQRVSCTTLQPFGAPQPALSANNEGLKHNPNKDKYKYQWRTSSLWKNSCYTLSFGFTDGSDQQALFKFE